jgi:hypothetical protein
MQTGLKKNSDSATFFLLCTNHCKSTITRPGALPPPLWHPPYAIMPYYLYTIGE